MSASVQWNQPLVPLHYSETPISEFQLCFRFKKYSGKKSKNSREVVSIALFKMRLKDTIVRRIPGREVLWDRKEASVRFQCNTEKKQNWWHHTRDFERCISPLIELVFDIFAVSKHLANPLNDLMMHWTQPGEIHFLIFFLHMASQRIFLRRWHTHTSALYYAHFDAI